MMRWNPKAVCDGVSAAERAAWCVENLGGLAAQKAPVSQVTIPGRPPNAVNW